MYVKYPMQGPTDYRGNVALVVASPDGKDIAYSTVDSIDTDMTELIEDEVALVTEQTGTAWLSVQEEYRKRLDALADSVRDSYKYPGQNTIDMEYEQVALVLKEWQAGGSVPEEVPDEILVWQEITGESLAWVVNDIEQSIASHRLMIKTIRRLRLMGKKAINDVPSDQIQAVYNQYATQLEAIRAVPDF
jgi:hypothetical protein